MDQSRCYLTQGTRWGHQCSMDTFFSSLKGWSGGAMVLGKTSGAGASYNLDYSRARAYCACSRCGWGLFGHFYSQLSFLSSFSLSWETARYRLKYCLKGPLNPKPINQSMDTFFSSLNILSRICFLFSFSFSGRRLDTDLITVSKGR